MKTDRLKGVKTALVSLGCDKNRVDSEVMLGLLAGEACVFTPDLGQARVIIINTCGFLKDALDESREVIEEALEQKRAGKCDALIVTGCAAQRHKKELFEDTPEIDAILGVKEFHRITDVLEHLLGNKTDRYVDFSEDDGEEMDESLHYGRILSTPGHYAYLKIAEGCDKKCTYCTIPKIRGPYKSRTMESLVEEARILAAGGVKELVLVAQDTTLYGMDIYGKVVLHELLRELSKIKEIQWLRLLYCYPENIYDELIGEIASNPKVLPYVDMPVQHASDRILKLMGRRGSNQELRGTINKLRKNIPDVTLRTTIITGFPGETKMDFAELWDFVRDMRFDRLGVFTYSREDGTPADKLPDHLPQKTKDARKERLMMAQQEISAEILSEKLGETLEVIVEGVAEGGIYYGRGRGDAPDMDGLVYISSDRPLEIGTFVQVCVTESTEYDLLGELL